LAGYKLYQPTKGLSYSTGTDQIRCSAELAEGALLHVLTVHTSKLMQGHDGSGICHMSSAKLGTKELIKLGASQFPDCICIGGRVQHYAESFPEGTRLTAVRCIIVCGSQRHAPVLESVCHQHFTTEGYQKDNFSTGSKLHHRRPETMGGNKTCF
jgi:hypothetical protein